ncbi:hypothetical protein [Microvirus mar51]|uniref:Peptidase M15A C-terminal domain-containing protein n=1 Tax=Microvirus mar51 TaxID=2851187 RepID=A0A8F5RC43_9VIRU|nr:hypothetical protein [Microvirus mar51]
MCINNYNTFDMKKSSFFNFIPSSSDGVCVPTDSQGISLAESFSSYVRTHTVFCHSYSRAGLIDEFKRLYPRYQYHLAYNDYLCVAEFLYFSNIKEITRAIDDFFYEKSINFSFNEFISSTKAEILMLRNYPIGYHKLDIIFLFPLVSLLQTVRAYANSPVIVNSGYRSPVLNKKVGGVKKSRHLCFKACDITFKFLFSGSEPWKPRYDDVIAFIKTLPFRYVEDHGTWVHVDIQ